MLQQPLHTYARTHTDAHTHILVQFSRLVQISRANAANEQTYPATDILRAKTKYNKNNISTDLLAQLSFCAL